MDGNCRPNDVRFDLPLDPSVDSNNLGNKIWADLTDASDMGSASSSTMPAAVATSSSKAANCIVVSGHNSSNVNNSQSDQVSSNSVSHHQHQSALNHNNNNNNNINNSNSMSNSATGGPHGSHLVHSSQSKTSNSNAENSVCNDGNIFSSASDTATSPAWHSGTWSTASTSTSSGAAGASPGTSLVTNGTTSGQSSGSTSAKTQCSSGAPSSGSSTMATANNSGPSEHAVSDPILVGGRNRRSGSFPGSNDGPIVSPRSSEGLGVKMLEYVLGTSPTEELEAHMANLSMGPVVSSSSTNASASSNVASIVDPSSKSNKKSGRLIYLSRSLSLLRERGKRA